MIDTHVHYDHKRYNRDRDAHLAQIFTNGIARVINLPISFESNEQMRAKLSAYPQIFFGVGIHPNYAAETSFPDMNREHTLIGLADDPKTVAVGETGLDYCRITDPARRDRQKEWFEWHISLSLKKNLPLVLHIRDADDDAISILRSRGTDFRGVVHCFCRGYETACRYVDMGFRLGIGGMVTHYDAAELQDVVRRMPMDAFLLETDAPFVLPEGCIDKRNSSLNLPVIASKIAELKSMDPEDVVRTMDINAHWVFFNK